jgi:hypothetical protein
VKEELFEGKIIAIVSLAILLSSFIFWKFGTAPNSRAIVIPQNEDDYFQPKSRQDGH